MHCMYYNLKCFVQMGDSWNKVIDLERYKYVMIRKMRKQKEIHTPKTEAEKDVN